MALFVVRVWLPDRPGALGAVASRIGAVQADVVGIDILERGGGRAIDELTIDIADPQHVKLLVHEIGQVDGVDVEHVRPARAELIDRAAESVRVAAAVAVASGTDGRNLALVSGVIELFDADWSCLVDSRTGVVSAAAGGAELPSAEWLAAFIAGTGSGSGTGNFAAVDELARVSLTAQQMELVISRTHLPLRTGEREVLGLLAAIADQG